MADIVGTSNLLTALIALGGAVVGIAGTLKVTGSKYMNRQECIVSHKQVGERIDDIKMSITKEHQENREDHKTMFRKIDKLTEAIMKNQNSIGHP